MSPEQASGHRGAVTTASDVYGLGAVLYALLTGKAPFGSSSVVETIDAVRNRPPEPPRRLNAAVPRDLETICLKCLEKDPRRRYSSAQALADDLRAWLDARPIAARRVGAAERAWLWCRRRPAVAALSAAVLLAMVGGVAATIAVQAAANRLLEQKNADLQRANERVRQRFDLAAEAIRLFHGQVGNDLILKANQFKPLRDTLLGGALDFYGKLERLLRDQPDRASREAMGSAYFELGELTKTIGDKTAGLAAHRKGLAIRRELASEPAAGAPALDDVARSLYTAADLLDETGHPAEALADYQEVCEILERLPLTGPGSERRRASLGAAYSGIGFVLASTGKADEATPAFRKSGGDPDRTDRRIPRRHRIPAHPVAHA
jgi:tetratricopeptide (TPR) repeat protein